MAPWVRFPQTTAVDVLLSATQYRHFHPSSARTRTHEDGMGIVWDTAELVNLIYGAALGEGATSIREKLSDWRTRQQMATALKQVVLDFPDISDSVRKDLMQFVSDPDFLLRVSGGYVPEATISRLDHQLRACTASVNGTTAESLQGALSAAAERVIGSALTLGERAILAQMKASSKLLQAGQRETPSIPRNFVPDSLIPKDLLDRTSELAWLTTAIAEGRPGVWYLGPSFSGKTAFLAWCARNAIPAQHLVACFIRSTGERNSSSYLLRTLHRQLAAMVGRLSEPPFLLGELMDELTQLLDEAAARAISGASRVVIMLDGLDEAQDREDLSGVLGWLCERPRERVTLVLSSRTGVHVNLDAFEWLLQSQVVIDPCAAAVAERTAVLKELSQAEESGNGLGRWILAALAVHTFGLTSVDIERLVSPMTGVSSGALEMVLKASLGRSVEYVPSAGQRVFRIAHDEVLAETRAKLTSETGAIVSSTLDTLGLLESTGWPEVTPPFLLYPIVTTLCDAAVASDRSGATSLEVFEALIALLRNSSWAMLVRDDLDWAVNPDGVVSQVQRSIVKAFERGLIDRTDFLTLLARCGIMQIGGSRRQVSSVAAVCTATAHCGQPHAAAQRSWAIYDADVRLGVLTEIAQASARDGDMATALKIADSLDVSAARTSLQVRILRTSLGQGVADLRELAISCLQGVAEVNPDAFRQEVCARIVYSLFYLGYRAEAIQVLDTITSPEPLAYALRDLMNLKEEFDVEFRDKVMALAARIAGDTSPGRQDLLAGGLLIPALDRVSPAKSTELADALMKAIARLPRSSQRGALFASVSNGFGRCSRLREAFDVAVRIKSRVQRALAVSRLMQRLTDVDTELCSEMWDRIESDTSQASGYDITHIWGRVAFGLWYSGEISRADLAFTRALEGARMARPAERARAYAGLTRLCRFGHQFEKALLCLDLCEDAADLEPHTEESLRAEALVLASKPEMRGIWPRSVRDLAAVAERIAHRLPQGSALAAIGSAACLTRDLETAKAVWSRLERLAARVHLGTQMLVHGADLLDGKDTIKVLQELSELSEMTLKLGGKQWQLCALALECYTELGFSWPAETLFNRLLKEVDGLGVLGKEEAAFLERILAPRNLPKEQQLRIAVSARKLVLGQEYHFRERPSLALRLARVDESAFDQYRSQAVAALPQMHGLPLVRTAASWFQFCIEKGCAPPSDIWQMAERSAAPLRGGAKAQAALALAESGYDAGNVEAAGFWSTEALKGAAESKDAHARALWCAKILSSCATPNDVVEGALIELLVSGYMRLHLDAVPNWLLSQLIQRQELILVGFEDRKTGRPRQ